MIGLEIAKYRIAILSTDDFFKDIDPVFQNFISGNMSNYDIKLIISKGIPEVLKSKISITTAISTDNFLSYPSKNWKTIKEDNEYLTYILPENTNNNIDAVLKVNNSKEWYLYWNENNLNENNTHLFSHPLSSLLLYYLTVFNNDIFIHSSGVFDGQKGRIFTGFSGAGKSTMAKIWNINNNLVVHDDRLIVRKIQGVWKMFNTPVYIPDFSKEAVINSISLISHATTNHIEQIFGNKAVAKILSCCIQHDFDKTIIDTLLTSIIDFSNSVKVYELGFYPDDNIIDFLNKTD